MLQRGMVMLHLAQAGIITQESVILVLVHHAESGLKQYFSEDKNWGSMNELLI